MSNPTDISSIEQLLFEMPLYEVGNFTEKCPPLSIFGKTPMQKLRDDRVEGFCNQCGQSSPYKLQYSDLYDKEKYIDKGVARIVIVTAFCQRFTSHQISFWFRLTSPTIQKIGQYPSFADIANDESKKYKKLLKAEDANELHKAIGLAAHGVGVGSFVYLRRVLERLIQRRFDELREINSWNADEFGRLRMKEKINHLKGYIPDFLVENQEIYSVLSTGVHSLTESECLGWFPILKQSIVIILEDQMARERDEKARKEFAASIAKFRPPDT